MFASPIRARGTEGERNTHLAPSVTGSHVRASSSGKVEGMEADLYFVLVTLSFRTNLALTFGVARTRIPSGNSHLLPHKSKICEKGTCCAYAHPFGMRVRATPKVSQVRAHRCTYVHVREGDATHLAPSFPEGDDRCAQATRFVTAFLQNLIFSSVKKFSRSKENA